MDKIVIDDATIAKLGGLQFPLTLCNAEGEVLGYLSPMANREDREPLDPGVPEEELRRREQEESGRSLAQIVADLEGSAG